MKSVISILWSLCLIAPVVRAENKAAEIDRGAGVNNVYSAYTPERRRPFPPDILPVKIVVSAARKRVKMSDKVDLSVRILNENKTPQNIGTETCGVHRISGWTADNDAVWVQQGGSCRSNLISPVAIYLEPMKIYAQTLVLSFKPGIIKPGRVIFRLGLLYDRYVPA